MTTTGIPMPPAPAGPDADGPRARLLNAAVDHILEHGLGIALDAQLVRVERHGENGRCAPTEQQMAGAKVDRAHGIFDEHRPPLRAKIDRLDPRLAVGGAVVREDQSVAIR